MNKIRGFLLFAFAIVLVIASLKMMNWLPSAMQEGYMKRYPDLESMQTKLKIGDIYLPSYFPQRIKWPPSTLWGQTRPFTVVVMEFRNAKGDVDLVISQVSARSAFIPDGQVKIRQVTETMDYSLKGRNARLEAGFGSNDERCSRITWVEGKYRITIAMKSPPSELIKISESMLR